MEIPADRPTFSAADAAAEFVARHAAQGAFGGVLATPDSFREVLTLALEGHPISQEDYVVCQVALARGFSSAADVRGALERRLLGQVSGRVTGAELARRVDSALKVLLLRAYVFFRAGGLPWPVVGCFGEKSAVVFSEKSGNGLVVDPATGAPKADIDHASFGALSKDGVAEFRGAPHGGAPRAFFVRTADVVRLEG